MKPYPIETAPRDGSEIYLISVQPQEEGGRIISIHNGHWNGSEFMIGDAAARTDVGDGCATHWAPIDVFDFGSPDEISGARDRADDWRRRIWSRV